MEITPELCDHLQDNPDRPFAVTAIDHNVYAYDCCACFASRCRQLVDANTLPEVMRRIHVPIEHINTVAGALNGVSKDLRNHGDTRLGNRVRDISKRLFARLERRFNYSDRDYCPGRIGRPCVKEPKSLSSYSDVVAFNRVVVTA